MLHARHLHIRGSVVTHYKHTFAVSEPTAVSDAMSPLSLNNKSIDYTRHTRCILGIAAAASRVPVVLAACSRLGHSSTVSADKRPWRP